jgi:hypothetical protein
VRIPNLNEKGVLPIGVYDTTLEEIEERFGKFEINDRRIRLCERLKGYLDALRSTHLVLAVIVNGSFVSAKKTPSDIDLILILPTGHDLAAELPPFEASVLSPKAVKKRLKFDVLVAIEDSQSLSEYTTLFQKRKDKPGETKGVLRVLL